MKGKLSRKVLAFMLTLAMVVTYMPAFAMTAFAESTQPKTLTADSQEGFESACSEAVSGDTIQLGNGVFAIGPVDIDGKTLTFKGNGASETKIYIGNGGYDGNGGHGSNKTANMTFEDVTLDDLASDSGYLTGFTQAAGLTFRNVTFNVGFSNWGNKGGDVSFYNCTFNQNASGKYNVQELRSANGTKFLFEGCTFNSSSGRFINAYKQGGANSNIEVIVKGCSFKGESKEKAAVNLKTGYGDGCNITLYLLGNNTTDNVQTGSKTGEALFDDNSTHGTVYQGATKENAVKIWGNGAKVKVKKLPEAEVTTYDLTNEADLATLSKVVGQDGFPICDFSNGFSLGNDGMYTLQIPDCAYKFAATEEAGTSEYRNWYADYTVSFDKPVAKDSMGLVGYYGSWGIGLGFLAPMEVPEDVEVPLLNTAMNISGWTYDDIIEMVGEFYCGAFNLSSANNDTTMTVKLRIFDPEVFSDPDNIQNQNLYEEGVNTYTIKEIKYKLTKNGAIPKEAVNYTVAGTADERTPIPAGKFYIENGDMVKAEGDVTVGEKTAYFTDGKSIVVIDDDSKAVKTKQTSSIGEEDIPEEVQTAISSIKSEIETATKVSGVELTTEGEYSGVQAIVNKAVHLKANDDERSAIRSATELEIKVDVVVTPKGYTENQTLKFDLTPVATVIAKDESGKQTAKVEGVEVTNDMIDQTQNIRVSVYSDFDPKAVLHVADNGETTSYAMGQTPSGSTFTYDAEAKKATLIVHHFSDILLCNGDYVASIGSTPYKTFAEALAAVNDDETITMLCDATLTEEVAIPDNKTFTIDLNNTTLTTTAVTGFSIDAADLTVKNGTIKNTNTSGISRDTMETRTKAFFLWKDGTGSLTLDGVEVQSGGYSVNVDNNNNSNGAKNKKLIIKDSNLTSGKWAAVYAGGADASNELTITNSQIHSSWTGTNMAALQICMKATLENTTVTNDYGAAVSCFENVDLLVKGSGNSFSAPKEAIANSGNYQGSKITIEGGTFTSSNDIAAYLPGGDDITIKGGTFTGNTALAVKGGNVTINGGTFTANGAATNPSTAKESGANSTGDAIYVEDNYGNTGIKKGEFPHKVTLNINGGTFTSQNGYAVSARFVDDDDTDPAQINIQGGLFKSGNNKAAIYTDNSFAGAITASAGYYSAAPEDKYVAQGKVVRETTAEEKQAHGNDYLYKIGAAPVAQIGETKYETLADAITAVGKIENKTATIEMIDNETIQGNAGVTIPSSYNVTLDLKGKTITGVATKADASNVISNQGTLTITDSSANKDGIITNTGLSQTEAGDWWSDPRQNYANNVIKNKGILVINNGNLKKGIVGNICYAIDTWSNATTTINGGIVGNDVSGTAIRLANGYSGNGDAKLTINDGNVGNIWCQYLGNTNKMSFTMTGGTIGALTEWGGSVKTSYTFSGGIIRGTADFYGSSVNISGGTFNQAVFNQLYRYDDNYSTSNRFDISGGTFKDKVTVYQYHAISDNISITGGCFDDDVEAIYNNEGWYYYSAISGGVFANDTSCDWTHEIADGYMKVENTDPNTKEGYPYTVGKEIARLLYDYNGARYYARFASLKEAVDCAANYNTQGATNFVIQMMNNSNESSVISIPDGLKVELDLKGKTVSAIDTLEANSGLIIVENGANFTINDTSDEAPGMIKSGNKISAAVQVTSKDYYDENKTATLEVKNGTLEGYYYGIVGNGNRHNTSVTVSGGTVKGTCINDCTGIYNPQNGTLKISGGVVEGAVGVYVKSGTVAVVDGGTINGIGVKQDYAYNGNGADCTGDAFVIDCAGYPGGEPKVSITGGLFKSDNNHAVASYAKDGKTAVSKFISGGHFSDKPEDTCICDLYKAVADTEAYTGKGYNFTVVQCADVVVDPEQSKEVKATVEIDYLVDGSIQAHGFTPEILKMIEQETEVKGVKLTAEPKGSVPAGMQAVVDEAIKENQEQKEAIKTSNRIEIDVNIKVTPLSCETEEKEEGATITKIKTISFDLTPYADVKAYKTEGEVETMVFEQYNVEVTNDMIDQENDIIVSIYTGFPPDKIYHLDDNGKVIEKFTGEKITYNDKTGVASVTVHHFSSLLAMAENQSTGAVAEVISDGITTEYPTLAGAIGAAKSGDIISLLTDMTDTGELILPANVTFDGNGHKLSDNSSITIHDNGGTVQDVEFSNITNTAKKLSAIYAKNLSGEAVVTGCTFDNVDWDAIQITPVGGATVNVTGNTFRHTEEGMSKRYVHIQSDKNVDFSATVTKNKFYDCDKLEQTGLEVYYPSDEDKLALSGNYMESPMAVCIGTGNSYNNKTELAFPFKNEDLTENVAIVASFIDANGNVKLCPTLKDAINSVQNGGTVTLLQDASGEGIQINKDVTIDLGNHTYTLEGQLVGSTQTQTNGFQILKDHDVVIKNGTINVGDNVKTGEVKAGYPDECRLLIQNYANLTLDGVILDGTELNESREGRVPYVLSNNCGTTVIKDSTITAPEGGIAFDAYAYSASTYTAPKVTVEGNSAITGYVEIASAGDAGTNTQKVTFKKGTLNGSIILDETAKAANVSKDKDFNATAPAGYVWSSANSQGMQTLQKVVAEVVKTATDQEESDKVLGGYATAYAAVEAATSGTYVRMVDDSIEPTSKIVLFDTDLDLCGHELTPKCVIGIGSEVRDTGDTKGCIHVDKGNFDITLTDYDNIDPCWIPVWLSSDKEYKFVYITGINYKDKSEGNTFYVTYQPQLIGSDQDWAVIREAFKQQTELDYKDFTFDIPCEYTVTKSDGSTLNNKVRFTFEWNTLKEYAKAMAVPKASKGLFLKIKGNLLSASQSMNIYTKDAAMNSQSAPFPSTAAN